MVHRPSAHRPQGSEAEEVPERQRCCNKEEQRDEKDKITRETQKTSNTPKEN